MKTHRARIRRRARFDRADVPLAEMRALIARFAQQMRHGDFLRAKRPARREGAHAVRMPSREETRPRRRAARMRRVEILQPQPLRRHLIECGRLHMRMPVVARLLPAMVIAHHENDVGSGEELRAKGEEKESEELHGWSMKRRLVWLPAIKPGPFLILTPCQYQPGPSNSAPPCPPPSPEHSWQTLAATGSGRPRAGAACV
jgi:hypothetical protein